MPKPAEFYRLNIVTHDGPMRMLVPSRTKGHPPYLVELNAYNGNGACQCKDFTCRFEPLLKRGYTPERAFKEGLVTIPPWSVFVDDCLRCFHCHAGRLKFADDVVNAIGDANKLHGDGNPF